MHAKIRRVEFDPDPCSLPSDPGSFVLLARLLLGPDDGPGAESFDLTVSSPEWLAKECGRLGIVDGRHHLVVNVDDFDERILRTWLEKRVASVKGSTWHDMAERLSRLGFWEFEDYHPAAALTPTRFRALTRQLSRPGPHLVA